MLENLRMLGKHFMNQLERYRQSISTKMAAVWSWLQQILLFAIFPSQRIRWRDVWNQFLLRLCVLKSRITVDRKEKKRLLEWVATKIRQGKPPTDFNQSWKDGVALCALVEGIVKGSCPRYDLLNPEQAQSNLKLGLHLIENNVRIKPGVTLEDFIHCNSVTERKLVCLVSQLKLASAKLRLKSAIQLPVIKLNAVTTIGTEQECIAKGMGLMLAVKGRKARFHIYLHAFSLINIVIEIRGPENTICSERITNRSPRRRSLTKSRKGDEHWRKIPLEYTIQPGKITVGYTPLVIGSHRLSIIWQGQHIIGSPYTISVDDAARTAAAEPKEIKRLFVPHRRAYSVQEYANKAQVRYRKSSCSEGAKLGNVTKRRILRHYVTVDGREVVIENSEIETLANAVKNIRIKNKSDSNECGVSDSHKFTHSDNSRDIHLTEGIKKENLSSKSNLDSTVENCEPVIISATQACDENSICYALNGKECLSDAKQPILQKCDHYVISQTEESTCHSSEHLSAKKSHASIAASADDQILSSNNLAQTRLSLHDKSKNTFIAKETAIIHPSTCNEQCLKQITEKSDATDCKSLPNECHKIPRSSFQEIKTVQSLSSPTIVKENYEESIAKSHKGMLNSDYLHSRSRPKNLCLASEVQETTITLPYKERSNLAQDSEEKEKRIELVNQFLDFHKNPKQPIALVALDSSHEDDFSNDVLSNKATASKEGNHIETSPSVMAAPTKSTISTALSPVLSCSPSKVQNKTTRETITNEDFESKLVEINNATEEKEDLAKYPIIKVQPIDNTGAEISDLKWNATKGPNDAGNSKKRSEEPESFSDKRHGKYFSNWSLPHLQTVPLILPHSDITNIREHCVKIEATNLPEKICSKTLNPVFFQHANILSPKHHLITDVNEIIEDYNSREEISGEERDRNQKSNTQEHILDSVNIADVPNYESEDFTEYDQKTYLMDNKSIMNSQDINKVEEKQIIGDFTKTNFKTDVEITTAEEEETTSQQPTNINVGSDERGRLLLEQNENQIDIGECQERSDLEDNDDTSQQGDSIFQHMVEKANEKKMLSSNEEIIQQKYNWKDHQREGFLLGLINEHFKILELPKAEEPELPKSYHLEFQDEILSNSDILKEHDAGSTERVVDSIQSEISMEYDAISLSGLQSESNSDTGTMVNNYNTNLSTDSNGKSIYFSQRNFQGQSENLKSFNGSKVNGSYLEEPVPEQNQYATNFEICDDISLEDSHSTKVSHNQVLQHAVSSINSKLNIDQNRTSSSKSLEQLACDDCSNDDNSKFNYKLKKTEAKSVSKTSDDSSSNVNVQNEIKLETSVEFSKPMLSNERSNIDELNILEESDKTVCIPSQDMICSSLQKEQIVSDNDTSTSLEVIDFQHESGNEIQQSSEIQECVKCCGEDEEEEFPFAAIVQAKKEYWEKKLEEKTLQVPKTCSVKKDGNNVGRLKDFWQQIARD